MRSLWVDDAKPEPEGCAVARSYDDAVRMCRRWRYDTIYLDHDLGDAQGRTGLDLLRQLIAEGICPPKMVCISWNSVGRANIEAEWKDWSTRVPEGGTTRTRVGTRSKASGGTTTG